ncbi:MAG: ABC transporter ATP-binding protein [Actinomycetota bacterium]
MSALALLDITGVSVAFGGLLALDDATIAVEEACVTGLIGPNGAGKTTLFNVVTGLQEPTSGRVALDGRDITRARPHRRARLGVSRTFQRLEVFGSLTARENVLVAAERRCGVFGSARAARLTDDLLDRVGIRDVAETTVESVSTGTARLVEMARALAIEPRVLLLDEPSSGLNEDETAAMSRLLVSLAREGLGVLLVEHDMRFVMGTCVHINVLDFGRIIARGSPAEIQVNPAVQAAYLGSSAEP